MFLTAQGGFLGPFAWILGKLLDFIYNLLANGDGIANLGLCIIIFTIVVKIIIFPFTFHQQKSSKINMVIQPEIQKIQKKYKDKKDQESMLKQQQEMQEVYSKYGTSMTGGCLPSLIQLPIIYALYRVIQNIPAYVGKVYDMYSPIAQSIMNNKGDKIQEFLIEFVNTNKINGASAGISKIKNLTEVGVDNVIDVISNFGVSHFNALLETLGLSGDAGLLGEVDKIDQIHSFIFGINISEAPGYKLSWALIIPISSALFQYLSMKISTSKQQGDPASNSMMKTMMITMPVMSLFLCITLPAGIGIYWSVSALFSLLTQLAINCYYDHTDMDAILEKQMEKAAAKREKNGGKKSFMERMMEQSQEAQEELEKREAMRKNAASSLKNYVPSEDAKKAIENRTNKKYKEGSIGSKANIMLNYNNGNKEEK